MYNTSTNFSFFKILNYKNLAIFFKFLIFYSLNYF